MTFVLLVLALIFFILAAIPTVPQKVNYIAVGLALWEAAQLVGGPAWPTFLR